MVKSLLKRFEEKYITEPMSGCWIWIGSCSEKGGQIRIASYKTKAATRVSYELFCGPIPENMVVYHKCHNYLCVNPDHLDIRNYNREYLKNRNHNDEIHSKNISYDKLSKEEINSIYFSEDSPSFLSKKYKVSESLITGIRKKDFYRKITEDYPLSPYFKNTPNYPKIRKGQKHLSKEIVLKIYNDDSPVNELSKKYNIKAEKIKNIKFGITWSDITGHKQ
jgi:hypothetical protein